MDKIPQTAVVIDTEDLEEVTQLLEDAGILYMTEAHA